MIANNDLDNNTDDNEQVYYVQQFKSKIFKRIPGKIRKNAHISNIFADTFKFYHMAIGININIIDDYQQYK
jgi:hypothetical protein